MGMRIGAGPAATEGGARSAGLGPRRSGLVLLIGSLVGSFLGALTAPAQAQFVCTTTSTDDTCTNTGTVTTNLNHFGLTNHTVTTSNSGTSAGFLSESSGNGNATASNTGSNLATINGLEAIALGTGTATVTNSGINTGGMSAETNLGDAFVTNSGSNTGGMSINSGGNGIATNSGTNTNSVSVQAVFNATAVNTGTNFGNLQAISLTTGDATATNSGTNTGDVSAETITGNATATNFGTNGVGVGALGGVFATSTGGNATAINAGFNNNPAGIGVRATTTTAGTTATVVNSGTNLGGPLLATSSSGGNATVINTGITTHNVGFAITASTAGGGNATVVNTGSVTGQVSLTAPGGSEVLTNSGTIGSVGGAPAISFSGGPDTLNVLPGSIIVGSINLAGVNDRVNFFTGNQNLTFNTLAGATVTSTMPFVVSGNQAVTVDPTLFGLADKALMNFTGGVSSIIEEIGGGVAPSGAPALAFAPAPGSAAARVEAAFADIPALAYASDRAMAFKAPSVVAADGRAIWARGFGGESKQNPQDGLLGAHTAFYGGAVGFDMVALRDLRLGVFVGDGESRLSVDGNVGFTNTNTAFGGLYGRWQFVSFGRDSFLDFALHGGGSGNSTSRTVNNNLVAGGFETATGSYASGYISPELKYGVNVPLWAQVTLTPSLRLRYVAGFFGGYTESGTTAPLTVASRTTQDLEERGELKLTRATPIGLDLLLASVHVGAIGLERVGGTTVNTTLLGIGLPFATPGRNDVAGIVGGGGLEWRRAGGVSFFGAAEAIGFSDQSTVWSAKGGMRVAF